MMKFCTVHSHFLKMHICSFYSLYFCRCYVFLKIPCNLNDHISGSFTVLFLLDICFLSKDHSIPEGLAYFSSPLHLFLFLSISPLSHSGNIGTPQEYLLNPLIVLFCLCLTTCPHAFYCCLYFNDFQGFCI